MLKIKYNLASSEYLWRLFKYYYNNKNTNKNEIQMKKIQKTLENCDNDTILKYTSIHLSNLKIKI